VDNALKEELGTMYIDIPGFYEAFFGGVADLETASRVIFKDVKKAVIYFIMRRTVRIDGLKT
jgi:hypothetical protein